MFFLMRTVACIMLNGTGRQKLGVVSLLICSDSSDTFNDVLCKSR